MSPGNLVFQAYGKFKLLSPQTPYQWLILKPGVINTESESTVINDDNVLVKNSLFPMGKRVPDCETSVPTDDLKTYHRSLNKIGKAPEACAIFLKLINTYPKRMYQQEFQKYCRN